MAGVHRGRLLHPSRFAARLTPEQSASEVAHGRLRDPTVTFQLDQGFVILAVVSSYLRHDPESLGHAAGIEWRNAEVATSADVAGRDPRFLPPGALARALPPPPGPR